MWQVILLFPVTFYPKPMIEAFRFRPIFPSPAQGWSSRFALNDKFFSLIILVPTALTGYSPRSNSLPFFFRSSKKSFFT